MNPNVKCFDNQGETIDRYSIFLMDYEPRKTTYGDMYTCLGASENPYMGFGQYSEGMLDADIGIEVSFTDLPELVQKFVLERI